MGHSKNLALEIKMKPNYENIIKLLLCCLFVLAGMWLSGCGDNKKSFDPCEKPFIITGKKFVIFEYTYRYSYQCRKHDHSFEDSNFNKYSVGDTL